MTKRDKIGLAILAVLSVPFVAFASLFAYIAWWSSEAEQVVEESIKAIPNGSEVDGVRIYLRTDTLHVPQRDFSRPIVISEGDTYPTGPTLVGMFGPGAWVAQINVMGGPRYEFEIRRHEGEWHLWIYPISS